MEEIQSRSIGTLIEPDPIGFSFAAPGWLMLLGFLILIAIIFGFLRYLRYRRNKYRRVAAGIIESLPTKDLPVDQVIYRITETLNRVAVTSYNRSEVAHLYGSHWLRYLEEKSNSQIFSESSAEIISSTLYQGKQASLSEEALQKFYKESLHWIKSHRV